MPGETLALRRRTVPHREGASRDYSARHNPFTVSRAIVDVRKGASKTSLSGIHLPL